MYDRDYSFLFGATFLIILAICVIPAVFYLLTLQNALKAVSRENRKMPPANVWLLFIPLFNIVWLFLVVDAIGTSFKKEFEKYNVFKDDKPTYSIGLALAILECCSIIPILGGLAGLGALVCWIIHWVKVNETKNEILTLQANAVLPEGEKSIFL